MNPVKFSFKGITTVIDKDGIEKKKPIGLPKWKDITESKIVDGDKAFALRTGHLSGITCFDFDTIESYENLVSEHPDLKSCKTVQTRKGFHIYFQYDPSVVTTVGYFPDVDIRNDDAILICPPTTYKLKDGTFAEYKDLGGELVPIPDYLKHTIVKKKEKKVKESKEVKLIRPKDEDSIFLKNIIDAGLLSHLSTNYSSWIKVGMALKTIDALDLFLLFSKTSSKYDEKGCREAWNGFVPSNITIGSLYYWAKERDKMSYYALIERKKPLNNEFEIAQVAKCIVQDVFRKDDDFYIYDKYWTKTSQDDLRCYVMNELRQYVLVCIGVIVKQTELENYDEILTRLRSVLNSQINKVNGQKNILDQYRITMPKLEINLDVQPYYFCFKNCAFDLRTNTRVETYREDYITQHTGYDYEEPTQEQMDTVSQLIESIFPNPEKRRFYMSVLRTGMIGLAFEYMIFATGTGGNGKGLLNGFFGDMLGTTYYYKAQNTLLTEPMKGNGAKPEVANIGGKRTVLFSEPAENSKIQVNIMKELTGGGEICARQLYSGDCRVRLNLTAILEYNTKSKPTLNGEIDDAITRRLRVCEFDQRFKDRIDGVLPEGCQEKKPYYKTPDFTRLHRCALFKYLMKYNDIDLYETEVIRKDTLKYFNTSDDFLAWFETYYELTEDELDFVSLKEMLETYKHYFKGIKHALTRNAFLETFTTHFKFKDLKLFRERIKIDGVDYRSIFLRIKKIDE